MIIEILIGVLIVLLVVNFITTLVKKQNPDDTFIVRVFTTIWEKLYPNALVFGVLLILVALRLLDENSKWMQDVPDVAWMALGSIITILGQAIMNFTAPASPANPWPEVVKQLIGKRNEDKS